MSLETSWDWFEAQQQCNKNNDTLPYNASATPTSEFWSGVYQRQSLWIKILGCYDSQDMFDYQEFHMNNSSAGFCQDICASVNSIIFGIKEKNCLCLKRPIIARTIPSYHCNETCEDTEGVRFSECGGPNAYTVYTADSSFSLNLTKADYGGKTACVAVNCGTEKRFSISPSCSESYFGVCEDKGYVGCFEDQMPRTLSGKREWSNEMTIKLCRKICSDRKTKFFGVEYSSECFCGSHLTGRNNKAEHECKMKCSGDNRQICGGPWRINIYRNPYYEIVDRDATQNWTESMKWCKKWSLPTYLYGNVSLLNASHACRALHRTKDGLSWLGIAKEVYMGYDRGVMVDPNHRKTFLQCQKCNRTGCVFVDCFKKLNNVLCEKTLLDEVTTVDFALATPEDLRNLVTIITLIASLAVAFILASCSAIVTWYIRKKEAENKEEKTNLQSSNPSENLYANVNGDHEMIEYNSVQRPSPNDFSKQENPKQNLDEPYRGTIDGVYDHLGDKEITQNNNENVYDHASVAMEPEYGGYDTSAVTRNKFHEQATYDHAGSYSDYGQHDIQVEKLEDTYSRLHNITPRSGHS
ncbi:uncharacterized protein LOC133195140 [Saccostrea echinata]|uniref:uncharacterized protein LOC133195140 n=1 Tax=Saccostrea echinata TaxID=191078 RepID=UPI002A80F7F0|nr:uncharacterized protein LOC133195140 [Saccostrea echinata]